MTQPLRIAIVGAGVSGLSTHWFLEREARRFGMAVHVETWDPRPSPGGNLSTRSENGWQCENAAESILNSRRETHDLALELGLADRIVQASPKARKRFIVWKGALQTMGPRSLWANFPTWSSKLRALLEPMISRGPEDESVAAFATRRLGAGLLEEIVDPMVTGIYAASAERLSVKSAFPRLKDRELIHGSLTRGIWRAWREKRRQAPSESPKSGSYTFKGGMRELVEALSQHVTGPVHNNRPVHSIAKENGRWTLRSGQESASFDLLVLAIPAYDAAQIEGLPEACRTDLASLPYNPVAVVGLGFDRSQVQHPLDGFGFLVPRSEKRTILGTLFSSTLWPHAAPEGKVLLRTMVGGGRQPHLTQLTPPELIALVQAELSELLGVSGNPEFTHVKVWERGIPEYPVGHHLVQRRLRLTLEESGIFLAGNAWDGIGVNDCVAAALPRARSLLQTRPNL